jgi:hypothetical protein
MGSDWCSCLTNVVEAAYAPAVVRHLPQICRINPKTWGSIYLFLAGYF